MADGSILIGDTWEPR